MTHNKKKFDFDTPVDRGNTNSIKWGSRTVKHEGLISLSVADMDFAMDAQILEAMRTRLEHPVFGYEFMPESLNDSFAAWQLQQHDFRVDKESIVHLPGVVNGIAVAILSFSKPGDSVVIQTPVYPPFFGVVEDNDRKLLLNPLVYNNESLTWTMDLAALETLFLNDHPKMMLLCNPHNPVGRVWNKAELRDLVNLCFRHNVFLISDDIHADFIFSGHSYTPLADVVGQDHSGFIQLLSPAKSFNLPGLGLAFALIPDAEKRKTVQKKIRALGLSKPNTLASTAVQAAYANGAQWFKAVLAYIEKNQQIFTEELAAQLPWAGVSVAEGSFVAWVDLQESGLSHAELAHAIRNEAKLMLFDGLSFGEDGEFFFRFNLACSRMVVQKAVAAFSEALTDAKGRGRMAISLNSVLDKNCCS